ncbi:MAG: hypothetical protein MZV64_49575 [Ignavibacteriales bacterium]|nr:hypothetical protein [Ignavibacteriales bacterium]
MKSRSPRARRRGRRTPAIRRRRRRRGAGPEAHELVAVRTASRRWTALLAAVAPRARGRRAWRAAAGRRCPGRPAAQRFEFVRPRRASAAGPRP